MVGFQEMELLEATSHTENEANLFSAELILEDDSVLDSLESYSFFQAAQALYVPAALLDYKFKIMCEKGLLSRTMEYRHSKYLKEDLGAYDEAHFDSF